MRSRPALEPSAREPAAIKQPPIDPGLRALDRHCADGFGVVVGRPDTPDDRVAEALLPHGFKAGEQQARADPAFSGLGHNAGRTEEIATRRVVAGESHDLALLDRDEAGDGLAREGDLGFARPALGEILPDPREDFMFLRSKRAPDLDLLLAQSLERGTGWRQVIEPYEHVHGEATLWRSLLIAPLITPSTPQINRQPHVCFALYGPPDQFFCSPHVLRGPRPFKLEARYRQLKAKRIRRTFPGGARPSIALRLLRLPSPRGRRVPRILRSGGGLWIRSQSKPARAAHGLTGIGVRPGSSPGLH